MRVKCDSCNNKVLSDETSVGCGFVPFCNKGYWGGFCEQDFNDDIEYCTFRDDCKDYEEKLNK